MPNDVLNPCYDDSLLTQLGIAKVGNIGRANLNIAALAARAGYSASGETLEESSKSSKRHDGMP